MAEAEDGQEKSQEPTPKKRQDAREEGKVVTSKEMFVFISIVGASALALALRTGFGDIGQLWGNYLRLDSADNLDTQILVRLGDAWRHTLLLGLIAGVPLLLIVVGMQIAVGGLIFAPKAIGPKFEKINPMKGLARMFSKQSLVELTKSVLKVVLLAGIAAALLWGRISELSGLWSLGLFSATMTILTDLIWLIGALALGLSVIGAIDMVWQIYSHNESLKMTMKEVKDENKETNGSPEVKSRLRQLQYEASQNAQLRAALTEVPSATAIVTNPTHFAVALKYEHGEMSAPVVIAMGKGPMAHEIIRIAKESRVANVRIPLLARALYFTTRLGDEIDERLFTAVAGLLAYVYRLDRGLAADLPEIDIPQELRFNEAGHPL
ncbi:MAG: flagellar biosynthesis protein FlhB [Marivivens sp.]|nr:flagellar biosynthesis protein FlhB [Marivivens sp.]